MIAVDSMNSIDQVKGQLLDEFESGQSPDIASYLRRFPEYRQEILEFWVVLASSDRLSEVESDAADPESLTTDEEETVRDLCLALSFGPAWLEHAVDEQERTIVAVGEELRRVRRTPYKYGGTANRSWQRVAVYGWLAQMAASPDGIISRLELQKLAYLLEVALGLGIFTAHKRHRLGPYDPTATYRDAEPKCVENGYLVPAGSYNFKIGPRINEALVYAGRYLREQAVAEAFLGLFRELRLDKWDLETLATVHSVAATLSMAGHEVSVGGVRAALAADETWRKKLRRSNFTTAKLAKALKILSCLRLLELGATPDE